MPPRRNSRHLYCLGFKDPDDMPGDLQLTEREPFLYRNLPDNKQHTVVQGDTLHRLAAKFFAPIESAANLWWIIADFQPDPIHDPTIALVPGSVLVIPSVRTVVEALFSDDRRLESSL